MSERPEDVKVPTSAIFDHGSRIVSIGVRPHTFPQENMGRTPHPPPSAPKENGIGRRLNCLPFLGLESKILEMGLFP